MPGEVDKEGVRELNKLKENDYNVGSYYLIWLRKKCADMRREERQEKLIGEKTGHLREDKKLFETEHSGLRATRIRGIDQRME